MTVGTPAFAKACPRVARAVLVAAACASTLAWAQAPRDATATERRVEIRADAKVTAAQRERLQRHADLGMDALRRYVWITRGIHNWQVGELVRQS
ncbi:hypothetical protein BURK1_01984 [Burkholderiales bacterium]|nr:hypothetical protein BURK1_01984 [Burkholderiales bacterium]